MSSVSTVDDHGLRPPEGHDELCPVCDDTPRVLVAISHPAMRAMTCELLEREFGCWVAAVLGDDQRLAEAIERDRPDIVVLDAGDFPACCRAALRRFTPERVIVVGPEPDRSYRAAALAGGAGAWIPRDRVGDDLAAELRRLLGCIHSPCPAGPIGPSPSLCQGPLPQARMRPFAEHQIRSPGGCRPAAIGGHWTIDAPVSGPPALFAPYRGGIKP